MKVILFIILSTVFFSNPSLAEVIVVVASPTLKETISIEDLKKIYLLNGSRTTSGTVVMPIDYKEDNPLREEFYQKVFSRSKVHMKSYWAQRIFTGKGFPPEAVDSAKEAKALMLERRTPMISYMKESEVDSRFTIVMKIPN